jgi:predicted  nucleic acid-binding Zn-ribbon protein
VCRDALQRDAGRLEILGRELSSIEAERDALNEEVMRLEGVEEDLRRDIDASKGRLDASISVAEAMVKSSEDRCRRSVKPLTVK